MCNTPGLSRVCRESYNDPVEVYEQLKRLGMSMVTVTDHDSIEATEALRRYPDGHSGRAEDWEQWWQSVAADPALAEAAAQRARSHVHHGSEGSLLATHITALRAAGFAEMGTLWQRGSSRVLCGVR